MRRAYYCRQGNKTKKRKVKRAAVIGCPGAGKSSFARSLRDRTGLPPHYLDTIWHKADRTNYTREEFDQSLSDILKCDEWIIDGNYLRTLPPRLERCDSVFLLDIDLDTCLEGAKTRIDKPHGHLLQTNQHKPHRTKQRVDTTARDVAKGDG